MDLLANNHTLCQVGPPNNLTPSMVLLLLLLMMGMVILLQLLVVMVSRFLGMVRLVDSRWHLVMLRPDRLVVMVSTLPHNLDTVNKQLQTQVMVTKEVWIRVMVVVKGWGMVQRHLFSQLIPNQHQLRFRLRLLFRFSLGMIKQVGDTQLHSHRLSRSHKQVVMVSMIAVRCIVSVVFS